ncbi:MAG: PAS domain S-box protein [Treponemataceae bacterium]
MEYRLLKANGEYGWVFDHGCPKYHDKEFIGYIGSCVDVSQNKKYENILRESEEKYRLLHEYAGVGIGYYNPDGIVLSYNQLAAKYMGGVPEDFIGKSIFDLFPKSDADLYFERIKRAAASEASVVYEDIVPLPTGNMYFLSTFTKILDISGSLLGIQIISQDISKQKDLENELQIKEARYRKAQEVAHVGSWEYDIHTDKFWGSEEGKRIYGFTLTTDNFTANDVMNCVIEKEKVNQAMIDLIDKNVPYNIEFTIIPHNSTERKTISSIAELVKDEQGNPIKVEGVMQDVTLSKKISEALENSEYMYRTLANTGQALIWTSGKDKLCDYFNKTWLNFTGRTLEQELGNGWTEGVHPDDFQHCLEIYTEAFDRREIFSMEYRIRRHDGEYRWLIDEGCPRYDNNSRFIGYIGHCLDITERKKSEQAVWEYGELYRSIMNASPDTIIITNMESRILMTSPKALAMFDCKEEELLNHLITDFITPEDQDLASLNVDQMFKGLISKLIEFRVFRADGTYFILEANMEFICDSNKQPIQIVFILRNISERKQAEERIKTLLAEKELILKEVHHRIKNNMSTMMSLLSLQAGNAKSDFARIALQDAEKRMQSMGILYDKLYRSADFKMLSVKEYISALVDDILSNFPNKNIVTVNKSIQDFVLDANRLQPIGIIINELLTNIMKYAFRGRENGLISVSATNVYGHVAISIQDDGSGIPSSVSFENSKGFGLQLVQALTHQLDGTITIERGNGTKIIVEFEK